jgi:hypothetical protein
LLKIKLHSSRARRAFIEIRIQNRIVGTPQRRDGKSMNLDTQVGYVLKFPPTEPDPKPDPKPDPEREPGADPDLIPAMDPEPEPLPM